MIDGDFWTLIKNDSLVIVHTQKRASFSKRGKRREKGEGSPIKMCGEHASPSGVVEGHEASTIYYI